MQNSSLLYIRAARLRLVATLALYRPSSNIWMLGMTLADTQATAGLDLSGGSSLTRLSFHASVSPRSLAEQRRSVGAPVNMLFLSVQSYCGCRIIQSKTLI